MTATAAIAVLMFAGAAAFIAWAVTSCARWMRRHHPRQMARRITDRPRQDQRNWQREFERTNRP